MAIFRNLAALALREVAQSVWQSVGSNGLQAVVGCLSQHFMDQSQRLTKALQKANDHAWTALEVALAGESLWQRVKLVFASGENKAFREQVQVFLKAVPFAELSGSQFRQSCLRELQAAGKAGLLTAGVIDTDSLVERAAAFTRFADPERLLDAEWLAIRGIADELDEAGYSNLAQLLRLKAVHGAPLLVVAVQYFFRREVETDRELFQGLTWAKLEGIGQAQEEGFASLARALDQHAGRFQELLAGVHEVVIATHDKVLDILGEQRRQGDVVQVLYDKVIDQQRRFALLGRELRPGDSLSIRGENERQLVKALVLRFRALPTKQQQQMPALINALGKLEVLAGDFDPAQQLFREVATIVPDARAQAEVHYNAY